MSKKYDEFKESPMYEWLDITHLVSGVAELGVIVFGGLYWAVKKLRI